MRILFVVVILIITVSCNTAKPEGFQNFQILKGKWQRINDAPGKTTYESWHPSHDGKWIGLGYTMHESDTVFKENLSIYYDNNSWNLKVTGVNDDPTIFKIIELTEQSFKAVNPKNEFPKEIYYQLSTDTLKAYVKADSMKIDFIFSKIKL